MSNPVEKHRIHPALVGLATDIGTLNPDPRNARGHDERNIKAVADSYDAHGQRKPVVVQRVADNGTRMVVRAGNGQVEAAKRLGWTHVAAVVIDENDKEAIAFALRDNRTAELAEWDLENLGWSLKALDEAGIAPTDIGWTTYESEPLMEADWSPKPPTDEQFDVPPKKEHIVFTPQQWAEIKALVGEPKPTAETIIRLLKAGRIHEQETVS